MKINFNRNILDLKQSDIRRMTLECDKYPDGINLSQGICDLDLPDVLINGVNNAVTQGYNVYTRYTGIDELRKGIKDKLLYFNKIEYDSENEIVVTSGSSGAFFLVLFSILNKKDEIILFEPFYGYHYNTIKALGMNPKIIEMDPDKNWKIDFDELEKNISINTKAIVLNTPSNPSGKVFTNEEIIKLGDIALKYNLLLITDEIYEYITYDNVDHISPASIKKYKEITVTIGGFSKTFSITGWRIGYICSNPEIIKFIGVLNDLFYICAPSPLQKAVSDGLKMDNSFFLNLSKFYQKNRDLLVNTLDKIGIKYYLPKGSYYLLADIEKFGFKNSKKASDFILKETGIASVPGRSFFLKNKKRGENMVRFCFAKKYDVLKKACEKLSYLK